MLLYHSTVLKGRCFESPVRATPCKCSAPFVDLNAHAQECHCQCFLPSTVLVGRTETGSRRRNVYKTRLLKCVGGGGVRRGALRKPHPSILPSFLPPLEISTEEKAPPVETGGMCSTAVQPNGFDPCVLMIPSEHVTGWPWAYYTASFSLSARLQLIPLRGQRRDIQQSPHTWDFNPHQDSGLPSFPQLVVVVFVVVFVFYPRLITPFDRAAPAPKEQSNP